MKKNEIDSEVSPEDQLKKLIDEWNDLDSTPVDLLKLQQIKGNN